MRLSPRHALLALVVLGTEVLIALYAHDRIVRPFVGDVLVVVLLYCALGSVLRTRGLAFGVLGFACAVEVLQAFDYVALLHLEHHRWVSIMLGRTFSWGDLLAYATGFALVRAGEAVVRSRV